MYITRIICIINPSLLFTVFIEFITRHVLSILYLYTLYTLYIIGLILSYSKSIWMALIRDQQQPSYARTLNATQYQPSHASARLGRPSLVLLLSAPFYAKTYMLQLPGLALQMYSAKHVALYNHNYKCYQCIYSYVNLIWVIKLCSGVNSYG